MDTVTYALCKKNINKSIASANLGVKSISQNSEGNLVVTTKDDKEFILSIDGNLTQAQKDKLNSLDDNLLNKFSVVNSKLYFDSKQILTYDDLKDIGLIDETTIANMKYHLSNTSIHLTEEEKKKLNETNDKTEITTDVDGNKTISTNGVTSIYDKDGNIISTTIGGVKVDYNNDGTVNTTKINNLEVKQNSNGSSNIGDLKFSKDANDNVYVNNKSITTQTSTSINDSGNTVTTVVNGNITSITEKDSTGNIVSDKVLVNNKDLSEIIKNDSEWATKEDVDSVLSDTYSELGW